MFEPFFVESRNKGSTPLCTVASGSLSMATHPLRPFVGSNQSWVMREMHVFDAAAGPSWTG